MISQRKLEANRLNAQKSTGPVTAHGKFVSSRNALKTGKYAKVHRPTGIDRTPTLAEAQAEIAGLVNDFARTFKPASPAEHRYIKTLATAEWSIRQFEAIFGMAVIALMKSARAREAREKSAPRLTLVPRRKAAPAEAPVPEALPPAA